MCLLHTRTRYQEVLKKKRCYCVTLFRYSRPISRKAPASANRSRITHQAGRCPAIDSHVTSLLSSSDGTHPSTCAVFFDDSCCLVGNHTYFPIFPRLASLHSTKELQAFLSETMTLGNSLMLIWRFPRGGGGGTQVQRGAAPSLRISRKKGSFFKTSACPRFCKRRVLCCTQVRSMGVKIPLQSTKYTRL